LGQVPACGRAPVVDASGVVLVIRSAVVANVGGESVVKRDDDRVAFSPAFCLSHDNICTRLFTTAGLCSRHHPGPVLPPCESF